MAYTMKKGGAVKIVDTDIQKRELLDNGFKVVSGSVTSGKTNVLGSKPYMRESMSNSGNINFRGTGYDGEPLDSLGYIAKKQEPGIADANFPPLYELQRVPKDADVFTAITFVDALPDSPEENVIYILSKADGVKAQGTAWYFNDVWVEYTAGDELDVALGAKNKLALITDASVKTVPAGTTNSKTAIEAAMIALAQAKVGAAYTPTIAAGSEYTVGTKVWVGKFTVTSTTVATNTATDAADRTITVVIAT